MHQKASTVSNLLDPFGILVVFGFCVTCKGWGGDAGGGCASLAAGASARAAGASARAAASDAAVGAGERWQVAPREEVGLWRSAFVAAAHEAERGATSDADAGATPGGTAVARGRTGSGSGAPALVSQSLFEGPRAVAGGV